ncbi:MAG: hypothetical protein RMJ39_10220 [Deltaproteobacteria bacterium]|nr:hypothetical protein [Deltaproteobacteria bacterium]
MRNVITQALGIGEPLVPSVKKRYFKREGFNSFCTDGLTDMLTDEEILSISLAKGEELSNLAKSLVEEANNRGGKDNITVMLIYIHP